MTDKLTTIHPQLGKFDFYEAKKKAEYVNGHIYSSREAIDVAMKGE